MLAAPRSDLTRAGAHSPYHASRQPESRYPLSKQWDRASPGGLQRECRARRIYELDKTVPAIRWSRPCSSRWRRPRRRTGRRRVCIDAGEVRGCCLLSVPAERRVDRGNGVRPRLHSSMRLRHDDSGRPVLLVPVRPRLQRQWDQGYSPVQRRLADGTGHWRIPRLRIGHCDSLRCADDMRVRRRNRGRSHHDPLFLADLLHARSKETT